MQCCLGGTKVRSGISINVGAFGDSLREYLRDSGYTQKDLADAIGLHPKVLSRKLRGSSNAHLTQLDVKSIITTLARWNVITTRDEALHLLNQAQVGPTRFSTDEWQAPPLSQLTLDHIQPAPSSVSSTPTRT